MALDFPPPSAGMDFSFSKWGNGKFTLELVSVLASLWRFPSFRLHCILFKDGNDLSNTWSETLNNVRCIRPRIKKCITAIIAIATVRVLTLVVVMMQLLHTA